MFWKSIQVNEKRHIVIWAIIAAVMLSTGKTKADFILGDPTPVPNVSSNAGDTYVRIAADGLSLYITSLRTGGYGDRDLWVAKRPTESDGWGTPVNLGPTINTNKWDACASISADDLTLYFYSQDRPGGPGGFDLWVSTRETTEDDWGEPENMEPTFNTKGHNWAPNISADNLSLYFACDRPGTSGDCDIWVSARETTQDDWGTPVNLGPTVNWSGWDCKPDISADGRTLFFTRREPPSEDYDIWVTRRATIHDDWGTPIPLPINTLYAEGSQSISADGSTLYFVSNRPATPSCDIWQAPILPVVDLNGDRIVDAADMCIIVDHWGENYPLCDIGPTPLGDGIVDVQDLIVLSGHLFEDYRIISHWMLDETEGDVAFDSISGNDGILNGDPIWKPTQGKVNGALQFDSTDDYMSTPFVLDPTAGPFSLLAWIKSGQAGRAIISQAGSLCDWLATGPTGQLKTTLPHPSFPALASDWAITDGLWHHIGLVCDAASTTLYVDGAEAAGNNVPPILPAQGGLYIGAGRNLEPGTHWSGLIDDIRIYSAALSAEEIEALAR